MFLSAGEHVKGTLEDPGKGSVRATGKGKGVSLLPDPGLDLRARTTNPSTSAALSPAPYELQLPVGIAAALTAPDREVLAKVVTMELRCLILK